MSIAIDDAKLHDIIMSTRGCVPTGAEIQAILEAAQVAAAVRPDDDGEENLLLRGVIAQLCASAEIDPRLIRPLSRVPSDAEERAAYLTGLRDRLMSAGARELAFVLSYLVVVADCELAPVEASLLDAMQRELAIPLDRAAALVASTAALVTPGA
jgi:hypothetical protein